MKIIWDNAVSKVQPEGGSSIETNQGVLEVDCLLSFSISLPNEPTSHSVEEGEPITDHILTLPYEVSAECIVSQTPTKETLGQITFKRLDLGLLQPRTLSIGASTFRSPARWSTARELFGAVVLYSDDQYDFVQQAYDTLVYLRDSKIVISLDETPRGLLEDLIITNIEDSVKHETGENMQFTISCVHHTTVTLNQIEAPEPVVERARPAAEESSEEGEEVTDQSPQQQQSWLSQLGSALRGEAS